MARETVTNAKITSDLTGRVYEGPDTPTQVKISINGKSVPLDLTPAEFDALTAYAAADKESAPAALAALHKTFATAPAPAPAGKPRASKSGSKSGGSKGANPENVAIREWVKADPTRVGLAADHDFGTGRGRMPREWAEAYAAANPAA